MTTDQQDQARALIGRYWPEPATPGDVRRSLEPVPPPPSEPARPLACLCLGAALALGALAGLWALWVGVTR